MKRIKIISISICILLIGSVLISFSATAASPNRPKSAKGPRGLEPGVSGEFYTNTTDTEGDDIYFQWDFDADGSHDYSAWLGPYSSGENCYVDHSWSVAGDYTINIMAKDDPNGDGDLSDGTESPVSWDKKVYVSLSPEQPAVYLPSNPRYGEEFIMTVDIYDPDTTKLKIQIDWGDGEGPGDWLPTGSSYNSEDSVEIIHAYDFPGIYTIQVKCAEVASETFAPRYLYRLGQETDWVINTISYGATPPSDPVLTTDNPLEGYVGDLYTFTVSAVEIDGDEMQFFFDWDDGTDSYWIPEDGAESEEEITATHVWNEPGDFTVRVRAHDEWGYVSNWTELTVHINRLKITGVTGGLGVSASITNVGEVAKDVDWSIDVVGGTLPILHVNTGASGSIEPLGVGATETISMPTFFGLGGFKIIITAECAGEPIVQETYDGFALFFYVMIR